MTAGEVLSGGFADPVFDSQAAFRSVLDALSQPGRIAEIPLRVAPPPPLSPGAGTIICTLADEGTPVWLDPGLANDAVRGWITFQTGAPIVRSPEQATFALIGVPLAMPPFSVFGQGTAEYPDRSTTLIIEVERLDGTNGMELTGPGIRDRATLSPSPLPADFMERMAENRALFPRGIDLLLVAGNRMAGLPRSVWVAGKKAV